MNKAATLLGVNADALVESLLAIHTVTRGEKIRVWRCVNLCRFAHSNALRPGLPTATLYGGAGVRLPRRHS